MKTLFKPLEKLMDLLTYPKKFLLIFLIFFIPLIAALSVMAINLTDEIETLHSERTGLESNQHLQAFIQLTQQHRGLTASYLGGNTTTLSQMEEKQAEINTVLEEIDTFIASAPSLTSFSSDWEALKDDWQTIAEDATTFSSGDAFDRHTALIADTLSLASQFSDTTKLSLDSSVTRNHLVKLITNDFIYPTEYMGQARALGSNVLASGTLTDQQENDLTYLTKITSERLSQARYSANLVFERNPRVRNELEALYTSAFDGSTAFTDIIETEIIDVSVLRFDANQYFDEATTAIDDVYLLIDELSTLLDDLLKEEINTLTFERNILLIGSAVSILLVIFLFIGFYRSVQANISQIKAATEEVAVGDLTKRITLRTKDETKAIATSVNQMIDTIQSLIKRNQSLAHDLSSAAEELSVSSNESTKASEVIALSTQTVAEGSEHQMTAVEQTDEAITQMTTYLETVVKDSETMAEMVDSTAQSTTAGVKTVTDVLQKMNQINTAVSNGVNNVQSLATRSQEISKIVALITDISEQTNLLALNAAIEAARAGEHGKGFAVVAEEVRKLADETNGSAEQIAQLVDQIQSETKETVKAMQEGSHHVSEGLTQTTEVKNVFETIHEEIKAVTNIVQSVSDRMVDVANENNKVKHNMEEVKQTAAQSANASQDTSAASEEQLATMEEISASAETLSSMADDLQDLIKQFNV